MAPALVGGTAPLSGCWASSDPNAACDFERGRLSVSAAAMSISSGGSIWGAEERSAPRPRGREAAACASGCPCGAGGCIAVSVSRSRWCSPLRSLSRSFLTNRRIREESAPAVGENNCTVAGATRAEAEAEAGPGAGAAEEEEEGERSEAGAEAESAGSTAGGRSDALASSAAAFLNAWMSALRGEGLSGLTAELRSGG